MLGYQTHSQGGTAGLSLCEPRDHAYSLVVQHLMAKASVTSAAPHPSLGSEPYQVPYSPRLHYEDAFRKMRRQILLPAEMVTSDASTADLPRLVEIEFAAFHDEKVNHHLSYRDAEDQAHVRRALHTYRKYMNSLRLPSTAVQPTRHMRKEHSSGLKEMPLGFRFRKVTVQGSKQIVAFCKSEMVAMTPNEMENPLDHGHEGEPQMNRDWFALNEKLHRQYCGLAKHCYFGMLATHPDFQQQGAASRLMEELIAEADRWGVEVYCEATRTGRALYEKYGFVAVKDISFATSAYGSDFGVEHQTVMVRGALGRNGKRHRIRSWDEALAASTQAFLNAGLDVDCLLDGRP